MAHGEGDDQDYFDTIHGHSSLGVGASDDPDAHMHADRGRHATMAEARARQAEVEGIQRALMIRENMSQEHSRDARGRCKTQHRFRMQEELKNSSGSRPGD